VDRPPSSAIARQTPRLSVEPFTSAAELLHRNNRVDFLALPAQDSDRYLAGFAVSDKAIDEALRLRYEVFNLELGEGLAESSTTGLDRDRFDDQMTHLALMERLTGRIVGTYRVQTIHQALDAHGIYSAQEYVMDALEPILDRSVELGRACLALEHRTFPAIFALWLGIGAFMNAFEQQYLFGCCSLTTQNPDDGWRAMKTIRAKNYLHPELFVPATASYRCGPSEREHDPDLGAPLALPKLFRTYMRLGVKVVSEPALDREFGTVDFLVLLDGYKVSLSRLDILK